MNQDSILTTDACLLIFDPHQDKEWMQRIIRKERGRVSHLLLGGDYFDAFDFQRQVPIGEMAKYLLELKEEWGERMTVLLGNHDIPYVEAFPWSQNRLTPPKLIYKCPGWDSEKSVQVAKHLDWGFWERCRLFQSVNGFLVSHAGLAKQFWYEGRPDAEALQCLDEYADIARNYKYAEHVGLLCAGQARGGPFETGGITWQDWDAEFKDDLPVPQIVGHTPSPEGARRKGRSWCLDGGKTCYGILWRDGTLQVKGTPDP